MTGLFSCQPIEILEEVVFDYNKFGSMELSAAKKKIIDSYESKYSEPYIDHSLEKTPKKYIINWFENNFKTTGNENLFVMNILDASVKKSEIPNVNSKKYEEKTIFLFEVSFLAEFILYDDSTIVLANSFVEAKRTTTSGKFISLMESERIVDSLILDCLIDFSKKSEELILIHMSSFIL